MNKLHTCSGLAVLLISAAALAQEQETPPRQTPSTSQTEGTAADTTPPGETPKQGTAREPMDPRPSTSETEGTAADRTSPDKASTVSGRASPEIVGRQVVSPTDAPLGKVVEVVFDAKGQPDFVVIASEGKAAAVPYAAANSMMSGDKIVIDQSRLSRAPKMKQGEWRDASSTGWKSDSQRYWKNHQG
jgi:hypothetical protein